MPRKKIGPEYTAHMLAVKNLNYLRIGKIAIASFLYHNPNSNVVIHCDQSTKVRASLDFQYFIKRNLVHLADVEQHDNSWQFQKIGLLKSIAKLESNFYMDCDVRWNGILKIPDKCTSYVVEFKLGEKSPFKELVSYLKLGDSEIEMLNTSFVYLYPGNFSNQELDQIAFFHNEVIGACDSGSVAKLDIDQILRLSEQIGFSIFLSKSGRDHIGLKSHDGHMDGSFLESSYFGATGVEF